VIAPSGDRDALEQQPNVIVKIRPLVRELRQAEKQITQTEVTARAIVAVLKQIVGGARHLGEIDVRVVGRRVVMSAARRPGARENGRQFIRVVLGAVDGFEIEPRDAGLVGLAIERAARAHDANCIGGDASVDGDVKPGAFGSTAECKQTICAMLAEIGLKPSFIVLTSAPLDPSSPVETSGMHLYLTMMRALSLEAWKAMALDLVAVLKHRGLIFDRVENHRLIPSGARKKEGHRGSERSAHARIANARGKTSRLPGGVVAVVIVVIEYLTGRRDVGLARWVQRRTAA
jgi:hypothetical protein